MLSLDAETLARLDWANQPADEPFDLSVTDDERASIEDNYRWFARFSVDEKLEIARRHARIDKELRELGLARLRG